MTPRKPFSLDVTVGSYEHSADIDSAVYTLCSFRNSVLWNAQQTVFYNRFFTAVWCPRSANSHHGSHESSTRWYSGPRVPPHLRRARNPVQSVDRKSLPSFQSLPIPIRAGRVTQREACSILKFHTNSQSLEPLVCWVCGAFAISCICRSPRGLEPVSQSSWIHSVRARKLRKRSAS